MKLHYRCSQPITNNSGRLINKNIFPELPKRRFPSNNEHRMQIHSSSCCRINDPSERQHLYRSEIEMGAELGGVESPAASSVDIISMTLFEGRVTRAAGLNQRKVKFTRRTPSRVSAARIKHQLASVNDSRAATQRLYRVAGRCAPRTAVYEFAHDILRRLRSVNFTSRPGHVPRLSVNALLVRAR